MPTRSSNNKKTTQTSLPADAVEPTQALARRIEAQRRFEAEQRRAALAAMSDAAANRRSSSLINKDETTSGDDSDYTYEERKSNFGGVVVRGSTPRPRSVENLPARPEPVEPGDTEVTYFGGGPSRRVVIKKGQPGEGDPPQVIPVKMGPDLTAPKIGHPTIGRSKLLRDGGLKQLEVKKAPEKQADTSSKRHEAVYVGEPAANCRIDASPTTANTSNEVE